LIGISRWWLLSASSRRSISELVPLIRVFPAWLVSRGCLARSGVFVEQAPVSADRFLPELVGRGISGVVAIYIFK